MPADLAEQVERLAAPRRRLWSVDGWGFRLRDVLYFEARGGIFLAWLNAAGRKAAEITENLAALEKLGKGLFVRCHRNFLVAVDRIREISRRYSDNPAEPPEGRRTRPEADRGGGEECELRIDGTNRRIPVTSTYAKGVKKALGLRRLDHLVPEHKDDKLMRELGIIDFGWRDLYRLDPGDQGAVAAFMAEWKIVEFGLERTLHYFRQAGANVIDKRRLAKSIIWQNWRWIKKGIQKKFKGNIRTFWYTVKNALGGDEILETEDVDLFYDSLRELIEERRLFRYRDFGFMDMKKEFREIGRKRPEIVLVFEKVGQFDEAKLLGRKVGSTVICLGGEPSLLTLEYFSDELRKVVGERELAVFIMTDLNPAGESIRNNFLEGMGKQGMKIGRTMVLWSLKDIPGATLGAKVKVVKFERKGEQIIPIKPASVSSVRKALRWYEAMGDPRLMTEQEYPGGKRVYTIWGVDSDTANQALVRRRFLEGAAQVPRAGQPGRKTS